MAEKWIQKAHLKKGAFTAQAKDAGMGVQSFASKVISKAKKKPEGEKGSTLLKRALLAKTFAKMRKH